MDSETLFIFTGIGGHNRIWGAFNRITMVQGWHIIRATVSPYSLTYWEPKEQASGLIRPSAFLAKDEPKILSAQTERTSQIENYTTFSKLEGSQLQGGLADNTTSYKLDYTAPSERKHWQFILEHKNIEYELGMGGGSGLTGFIGTTTVVRRMRV
ncbi:hypothetical protein B0O99DRAFT_686243 [Bisporella sp. PMI_857]|jgi:hypothetical protein|nr:hypothetical protein B0O99DRAFT_686243 [Bisporella sp. PMI_857]